MLSLKNKFISNTVFLIIFLVSISYSSFLYIKGDNVVVSNNSMTPLDVFLYSPQNDEIGVSIISSLSSREDSYLSIIEQLFFSNKNIEFVGTQNKLLGYSFRSTTYYFNYLGNIEELAIDHEKFKDYLWKNYSTQFKIELESQKKFTEIQKQNYKKIIEDVNRSKFINNFNDYNIKNCELKIEIDNFDQTNFETRVQELDYLCEFGLKNNRKFDKDSFFKLLQYKVLIKDSVNFISSRKYNAQYIIFSFLAFLSFVILLITNLKRIFK